MQSQTTFTLSFWVNATRIKNNQVSVFARVTVNGKRANILIFPNLESANITYKLMKQVDGVESIGPILLGMSKPVHILQLGASVDEMVNMAAVAVVDAQNKGNKN